MPLKELKIFCQHGKQYLPDLKNVELPSIFRGRPFINKDITIEESQLIASLCPVNAVISSPFSIDIGKCVFCNECHFALPEKIIFTNDYKIATNERNRLIIKSGQSEPIKIDSEKIRNKIKSFFCNTLRLRQVSAGGDNSAEMELNACGNVNFDMGRYGIEFVASPRQADGLVITGPISQNMAEALQICYDAIPEPKLIILVGTDAISGGIFAGSKTIDRSFLDKHRFSR